MDYIDGHAKNILTFGAPYVELLNSEEIIAIVRALVEERDAALTAVGSLSGHLETERAAHRQEGR